MSVLDFFEICRTEIERLFTVVLESELREYVNCWGKEDKFFWLVILALFQVDCLTETSKNLTVHGVSFLKHLVFKILGVGGPSSVESFVAELLQHFVFQVLHSVFSLHSCGSQQLRYLALLKRLCANLENVDFVQWSDYVERSQLISCESSGAVYCFVSSGI
jgi:hypothetical protein